jgi:hypothetical protein
MASHQHDWKEAPDWNWGPGTVTYECFPCRGLRVLKSAKLSSGSTGAPPSNVRSSRDPNARRTRP